MGIDSRTLHVPGMLDLMNYGIQIIIADQRGHGGSSRSPVTEYTHETWASDVHALVRSIGLSKFALLGHSYGGFIALEYAVRWPESLTHLVMVATSAGPVSSSRVPFASDVELCVHLRRLWGQFFAGNDKHWEIFEESVFSVKTYNAAFTRELPNYDLRERMRELDIPMLLIVGDQERYRAPMEWLAVNTPNAALCIFKECGHFPFIEAAAHFTTSVSSFLKDDRELTS